MMDLEEKRMSRVYNFSAGPAVLPESVLQEAAAEMKIAEAKRFALEQEAALAVGNAFKIVIVGNNKLFVLCNSYQHRNYYDS